MGKLYETFKGIDGKRSALIDALNDAGMDTDEKASFDMIANNIRNLQPGNYGKNIIEPFLWKRPVDWLDTKSIYENAPDIEGYFPFAVLLMHDKRDTFTYVLPTLSNAKNTGSIQQYSTSAFYTSDGSIYTNDTNTTLEITHSWDRTKDVTTSLPYKQRYIIIYAREEYLNYSNFNTTTMSLFYNVNNNPLNAGLLLDCSLDLYCAVPSDKTLGSIRIYLPVGKTLRGSPTSTYYFLGLQRIHTSSNIKYTYTDGISSFYPYNGVREIVIESKEPINLKSLNYSISPGYMSYKAIQLYAPNTTGLECDYTGGSYFYYSIFTYVYAPKLTYIKNTSDFSAQTMPFFAYYADIPHNIEVINTSSIVPFNNNLTKINKITSNTATESTSYGFAGKYLYGFIKDISKEEITIGGNINVPDTVTYLYNSSVLKIHGNYSFVFSNSRNHTIGLLMPNLIEIDNPKLFSPNSSYNSGPREMILGDGFRSNIDITNFVLMFRPQLLEFISKLADMTETGETRTLTLGTELLSRLTEEDKNRATSKGWVLE